MLRAVSKSPFRHACASCVISPGIWLETTEITPRPPRAASGIVTASSPECTVMLVQAFLCGLVVVRCNGEDAVRAQVLQLARQLDYFLGIVAAGARQHRDLVLGFFERDLDHAQMLRAGQRGALAGRAAGD